jgi:hypothetical protein
MKAVAAALLLIVGAAVVLWYGNTLNSWVLGGLIGGLAALLLSIPISLVLFSYLSRRHDERLKAQAEEEAAFALAQNFQDAPPRFRRTYEVEGYIRPAEEEYPRQIEQPRNLPVPTSSRLPVATQHPTNRAPAKSPAKKAPAVQARGANGRRTTGRMTYPGFPGYEPGSFHTQHRVPAMRAAQREAARQSQYDYDDVEVLPTHISKRLPPAPLDEDYGGQDWQPVTRRASRELPQRTDNLPRPRSRRTVDATPSQNGTSRSLSPADGSGSARFARNEEPHTDYLYPQDSQTEPLSRRISAPQTDQIARTGRRDGQFRHSETITGSIQKPLVRRAPYLYDDDPLCEELSRQIDAPPAVRRSSRLLEHDEEDM